jgi:hypothetical protein
MLQWNTRLLLVVAFALALAAVMGETGFDWGGLQFGW